MSPSRLAGVTVLALAAVGLSGCTTTKTVCNDGVCKVSFGGGKGDTDLSVGSGDDVPLTWTGTSNGTASISFGGEDGTCTQGQAVTLSGATVTCVEVSDDDLELTVS